MDFHPDDPLLAAVSPPRAARLRERLGIAPDEPLRADFSGWSKLVVLAADRALLFPRNHEMVGPLHRELEALRAVEGAGLAEIPRVLDVIDDPTLSPYPIAVLTRLPGTVLEAVLADLDLASLARIAEAVGARAARWHALDPGPLAARPPRQLAHRVELAALLGTAAEAPDPGHLGEAIAAELGWDRDAARRGAAAIARARDLAPVLVHGDVHEGQLLVDPDAGWALTGIVDWQTALVDHPFTEFDLGEWGATIWRRHRASFPALRRRYWNAYAGARGLPGDLGDVFEWVWSVSHALRRVRAADDAQGGDAEILGGADEALARAREATAALRG